MREAFGQARAPVRGTVNGVAFRSRLASYGGKAAGHGIDEGEGGEPSNRSAAS